MLRIVQALMPEARPVIELLGLRPGPGAGGFRVFVSESGDVALILSGIGKVAAAAATACLAMQDIPEETQTAAVWLNIGIAGHGSGTLGEAFLAHKVEDRATGRSFYPPLVFSPPCLTAPLVTVDRVEDEYGAPVLYDMEASGFMATATRFTTAELVHSLKVVSDGPAALAGEHRGVETLDAREIERLIRQRLDVVDALVQRLRQLHGEFHNLGAPPRVFAEYLARWHFTVSEERRLLQVLRRLEAVGWDAGTVPEDDLQALKRGKDVLRILDGILASRPVRFSS